MAESLIEVEEEQEAIEAELVRMNSSTQCKEKESSPDPFDVCRVFYRVPIMYIGIASRACMNSESC